MYIYIYPKFLEEVDVKKKKRVQKIKKDIELLISEVHMEKKKKKKKKKSMTLMTLHYIYIYIYPKKKSIKSKR